MNPFLPPSYAQRLAALTQKGRMCCGVCDCPLATGCASDCPIRLLDSMRLVALWDDDVSQTGELVEHGPYDSVAELLEDVESAKKAWLVLRRVYLSVDAAGLPAIKAALDSVDAAEREARRQARMAEFERNVRALYANQLKSLEAYGHLMDLRVLVAERDRLRTECEAEVARVRAEAASRV